MTIRRFRALVVAADSETELAQAEAELVAEGVPVALVSEGHQRTYLVADGYRAEWAL